MPHPLLESHKDLVSVMTRYGLDIDYLNRCLDPATPTHEVSLSKLFGFAVRVFHSLPHLYHDETKELIMRVESTLTDKGYRKDILSYQEHTLVGSTEDTDFEQRPYIPLGMLRAGLNLEETQQARSLQRRLVAIGTYFERKGERVTISLEPLDHSGNTQQDPRLLDKSFTPLETHYSPHFPFRRT